MLEQNPNYCDSAQIIEFEKTAIEFLREVLGLPPENCLFLSDESELDDFSSMQLPEDAIASMSWDSWVIEKVQAHYGIALSTTKINLVSLFNQVEQAKRAVLH